MKTSTQLKALVRNLSKAKKVEADAIIERIAESQILANLWERYQKRYSYAADVTWGTTINALQSLRACYLSR